MAIETNMQDKIFFAGDDWPNIPLQMTPPSSISGWTVEFSIYTEAGVLLFTETSDGGNVIMTGPGTDVASGLCYVSVFKANSGLIVVPAGRDFVNVLFRVHRAGPGVPRRELGFGTIPVRR
jgi:hypothetical protein